MCRIIYCDFSAVHQLFILFARAFTAAAARAIFATAAATRFTFFDFDYGKDKSNRKQNYTYNIGEIHYATPRSIPQR